MSSKNSNSNSNSSFNFYEEYIDTERETDYINEFKSIIEGFNEKTLKKFINRFLFYMDNHDFYYNATIDEKYHTIVKYIYIDYRHLIKKKNKKEIYDYHTDKGITLLFQLYNTNKYHEDKEIYLKGIIHMLDYIKYIKNDETSISFYLNLFKLQYNVVQYNELGLQYSNESFEYILDKLNTIFFDILNNHKKLINKLNFSDFFKEIEMTDDYYTKTLKETDWRNKRLDGSPPSFRSFKYHFMCDENILQLIVKNGIKIKTLSKNKEFFEEQIQCFVNTNYDILNIIHKENLKDITKVQAYGFLLQFSKYISETIICDIFIISNLISTDEGKTLIQNMEKSKLSEMRKYIYKQISYNENENTKTSVLSLNRIFENKDIQNKIMRKIYINEVKLLEFIEDLLITKFKSSIKSMKSNVRLNYQKFPSPNSKKI